MKIEFAQNKVAKNKYIYITVIQLTTISFIGLYTKGFMIYLLIDSRIHLKSGKFLGIIYVRPLIEIKYTQVGLQRDEQNRLIYCMLLN